MNKKRKLGMFLLASPIVLLVISFLGVILNNFILAPNSSAPFSPTLNIIFSLLATISVLGIMSVSIIGIVLVLVNKDEEQELNQPSSTGV